MLFLVAAFALGCGDDSAIVSGRDLSAPALDDLSAPALDDLSVVPDLSSLPPTDMTFVPIMCGDPPDAFPAERDASTFCDGTPLQGTCVQAFFKKIAACFAPAGCCVFANHNSPAIGWESGALWHRYTYGPYYRALYQDGRLCGSYDAAYNSHKWTAPDGSTLVVDEYTQVATCADGTQVDVGNNYSACSELSELVEPLPYVSGRCSGAPISNDASPECCTPYPVSWYW